MTRRLRRNKLPEPRMQLKIMMAFAGVTVCCLCFQFFLLTHLLGKLMGKIPEARSLISEQVPGLVTEFTVLAVAIQVPLALLIGLVTTFRIAGPIFRFKRHLERIANGETPQPCRLRPGDELHDLCDIMNRAVARLDETSPGAQVGNQEEERVAPAMADPA